MFLLLAQSKLTPHSSGTVMVRSILNATPHTKYTKEHKVGYLILQMKCLAS